MSDKELEWLFKTASSMRSVVEIGAWKGRTTYALANACPLVIAVDHFHGSIDELETVHKEVKYTDIYQVFKANIVRFGLKNVFVLKMDSIKAAEYIKPHSVDMVFIDGSHTYDDVLMDIKTWAPKVRLLLCGHDYGDNDVKQAVYNYYHDSVDNPVHSIWSVPICQL